MSMRVIGVALCGLFLSSLVPVAAEANSRLGAGIHYWRTVDSLDDGFDRDGVAYAITYQHQVAPAFRYQYDLQWYSSSYAGSEKRVYAPQALALAGVGLYGGMGIGILYSDGSFAKRPFYLLRAGFNIPVLPGVHLDLNANYHFSKWKGLNEVARDISSDTITLGAAVRFSF